MATEVFFDNRIVKLPGAYSTIVSGEQSQPLALDYGKVLVIDTGVEGANWGGGSGIDGALASGKDSIYTFNNLEDYQSFLKGGLFWKMADALFKPDKKTGAPGVSQVIHAKAATTAKATLSFTATGGGTAGGIFKVNPLDEGVCANGVMTSSHLDKGYGYTIETAPIDSAKWVYKIWLGTWTGDYTDSIAYNEIAKADTTPKLMATSPEFNNIQTLIDWATEDSAFGQYFVLDATSAKVGTGVVNSADISALTGAYQLATGGTESYSVTNLGLVLDAVAEEDFSFIICDQYGTDDYDSSEVTAITSFIVGDSKFKRFLFVGGGADESEFDDSLGMGAYYNSPYVKVTHANVGLASDLTADGFRYWPSVYHAAVMLGRTAGKQPQIPLTNKSLGVDKLVHSLTKAQKERALDAGIMVTHWNQYIQKFVCLQDVNTLQDNKRLFTAQGKSHSGSFMRIVEQVNKELVVNAEIDLLSDENGVTVGSLSAGKIKNWTETYLTNRLSTAETDNLLLDFRNVTVTRQGDAWKVNYGIVVNNEINKIFFTGFLFS